MKKVIVTGITGAIGQYISEPLKEFGFEVYGIGRRDFDTSDFNYIKVDINNYFEIENIFNKIQAKYLIHLAWDLSKGYFHSNANFDMLVSSINILKYFKNNGGKKAIYIGTYAEYSFDNVPAKEYDRLNPTTIYAKCKNYLREIAELYCKSNNIDFCWARLFNTYGENDNNTRLFPYIIRSLKNNQKVSINHSQLYKDYVYSGDVAKILSLIINSNITGIINVCSGNSIKLKDLAIMISEKLGKIDLLELNEFDTSEPLKSIGDNSRIVNELKFTNYVDINKIIDILIEEN
ncbi:NAD-dependent epimerase/dehydratase family protein [Brachyspira pilosicoli]|uniref:NAD-dependent epimerase/dehydratase family protein n=1 Tax=Brachyspira pilosicoli TaxID=52584 RepID=UPI0024318C26|nr:NAD-dependent epimerase/dehydratase family protein [Brachyspira pilosicoli]